MNLGQAHIGDRPVIATYNNGVWRCAVCRKKLKATNQYPLAAIAIQHFDKEHRGAH